MVYIDNMNCGYGRMVMCHMIADTTEELLQMVDKIGVNRKWIQDAGTYQEHFDICLSKKMIAVRKFGAKDVTMRELVKIMMNRKGAPELLKGWVNEPDNSQLKMF